MNNNSNQTNSNNKNANQKNASQYNEKISQNDKRFWIVIVVFVVLAGLVIWDSNRQGGNATQSDENTLIGTDNGVASTSAATSTDMSAPVTTTDTSPYISMPFYTYSCTGGKSITATFHLPKDDYVNIHMNNGQAMILAHVISADGARYANANESFVFWTRGNTAFINENGTTTYSDCVTS